MIASVGLAAPAWSACDAMGDYRGVALKRFSGSAAYAYSTSRIAIDADGAPNAYHPQDRGIDALANAGYPNGGWRSIIVPDPANPSRGYVQPSGPFAGYFVSMTTVQDTGKARTDPARYVDSTKVPYIVFPGAFYRMKGTGHRGVLGMARNLATGQTSPMIFADGGATNHELGEVSIKLAENLGGANVNPRTGRGAPRGPFAYVIFPGSETSPPWPRSDADLRDRAEAELARIGGWEAVTACLAR
ncbi:MAG: hypothetical protein JNL41_01805 [Phenylobacterium sp.]|uniref:glycoside hydrolase family 75 protein n=1 Tax=Phenylobacterium sp. TaxID=1871053 RepID=UPI001A5E55EA|nr:glycoside hydrolase family 75 protein [Phenylobacterium sp.]MBL8552983.1 hypothetical protein [Phenylobacterium sp.]